MSASGPVEAPIVHSARSRAEPHGLAGPGSSVLRSPSGSGTDFVRFRCILQYADAVLRVSLGHENMSCSQHFSRSSKGTL